MSRTYTSFSRFDWFAGIIAVLAWASLAGWAGLLHAADNSSSPLESPTHRQVRTITPTVNGKSVKLHTIATNQEGQLIVALGGASMKIESTPSGMTIKKLEEPGVVQVLDSEGGVSKQWDLDMTPSSIGVAPDGTIYIGGSGRIVQLGEDGSVNRSMDSPHIGDVDKFRKRTVDAMRKSMAGMSDVYESQIEKLKERVAAIKEKDEDDRSRLEDAQLKAFESQLKIFEGMLGKQDKDSKEDDQEDDALSMQIDYAVHQSMLVTSLAVSDQDVFACASGGGLGGYSVWRISRDLDPDSATEIKAGLSGCCGQMDIQCCDDNLLISENTKFKVGIYGRDGKQITDFGGRDRTSGAGFGSCCNPMNSMALSDGTILTAESSIGHIKRFDTEGNLIAYIGKASIGAGCKHCALGYDEQKDLYYMMYQDKNAICVLANHESSPLSVAEKQLMQRQTEFLARAAGDWKMEGATTSKKSLSGAIVSLFGGGRGGASPYPVASLTVGTDGTAKILKGMYQAYGDDAQIELLPEEEGGSSSPEEVSVALAIDQVRFLTGKWTFTDNDSVKLAFAGHQAVTLLRSSSSETRQSPCGGKDCADPNCDDKSCPQFVAADTPAKPNIAVIAKPAEAVQKSFAEPPRLIAPYEVQRRDEPDSTISSPTFVPPKAMGTCRPTFAYKLLKQKKLGKDPEAELNRMGAQGWEFCGRVGKQMMFKRVGKYEVAKVSE